MDELEIQGKKYISSKRASELTGYAKDYIGQMARSGKIPGMRMGRAWYIDKEALLSNQEIAPEQKKDSEVKVFHHVVSPIQRKSISPATLQALGYVPQDLPNTWSAVAYFPEETDLTPLPLRVHQVTENKLILPTPRATPFEKEVRIRILEGRVKPAVSFSEKKPVALRAKRIRAKRATSDTVLALGALSAALLVFLFFSSGLFLGSNLSFTGQNGTYTANILVGFDYVRDFLAHYPPFQNGINALTGFFGLLFNSFSNFFTMGIGFLKDIWNFIF